MCGLIATADTFVPIFLGDGFEKSIVLLRLLTPLIIIIGIASVTGQAMLVSMGKQTYYTITVLCGASANFILNIILIPRIQSVGAAIATLLAETIVTSMQIYGIRKDIKIIYILKNIKYFLGAGIMLILIWAIRILIQGYISNTTLLVVEIFGGVGVYSAFLFILKDRFTYELIMNIWRKVKK